MDNIDSCLYIEEERLHNYAASAAKLLLPQDNCPGTEAAALLRRSFGEIRRCHQAVERRYGSMAAPPSACGGSSGPRRTTAWCSGRSGSTAWP